MTRQTFAILLAVTLGAVAALGSVACTREVIKEVPVEVIKEVPVEVIKEVPVEVIKEVPTEVIKEVIKEVTKEVIKEVPLTVSGLAQKVREGDIDVGKDYGLAFGQRYHNIHTVTLGLACITCHVEQTTEVQEVFLAQDVAPLAPGPVDKRSCLGCHRTGLATGLYGQKAP